MQRTIEDPVETKTPNSPTTDSETTHPAFGMINASRVTGKIALFGSDFVHHDFIQISIDPAVLLRSHANDWYFPHGTKRLIEVNLSESQWATFVSSLNAGSGTPCTIDQVGREMMPGLPDPVRRTAQFEGEVRQRLAKAEAELKVLESAIQNGGLSARAKRDLQGHIHIIRNNLTSNVNFVAKQFGEHVERTTDAARVEINAHVNATLQRAGLAALRAGHPFELPAAEKTPADMREAADTFAESFGEPKTIEEAARPWLGNDDLCSACGNPGHEHSFDGVCPGGEAGDVRWSPA